MKAELLSLTIDRIIQDEASVSLRPNDSYQIAYREFVEYFAHRSEITSHDLIIGAHFVYGWMPTILELKLGDNPYGDVEQCAALLSTVRAGGALTESELAMLKALINNSMVGASKLLHFVSPRTYAIWDSRVYAYVFSKVPYQYQIQDPALYMAYLRCCRNIIADSRFPVIHESMNCKIGYSVTPLRALELVMFMST